MVKQDEADKASATVRVASAGKDGSSSAARIGREDSSELGKRGAPTGIFDEALARRHLGDMRIVSPQSIWSVKSSTYGLHGEYVGGGHGYGLPASIGPIRPN